MAPERKQSEGGRWEIGRESECDSRSIRESIREDMGRKRLGSSEKKQEEAKYGK